MFVSCWPSCLWAAGSWGWWSISLEGLYQMEVGVWDSCFLETEKKKAHE